MAELWQLSAEEAVGLLTAGDVSPLELVDASIARIEAVDGAVNALPLHRFDRARDDARRLGDVPPGDRGLLAGLPIAIKDLIDVEGMRTTYGCPLYADNVASKSDPLVTRLEARGGVVVAKSSSPEMGMMPVTTNRVFGHTRNPWNLETTPGGSSGGASAALAAGEVWLAHGSDIGGSLRIPAAFAGVCGLRPSPGRVPRTHSHRCFNPMSVQGPMARTVGDIALFLDAMAGYLPSDPLSLPDPEGSFRAEGKRPARIGYVADIGLGGVEPDVATVVEGALARIGYSGRAAGARFRQHVPPVLGDDRAQHPDRARGLHCGKPGEAGARAGPAARLLQHAHCGGFHLGGAGARRRVPAPLTRRSSRSMSS